MAGANTFEVLAPGILSTVQDLGRFGCTPKRSTGST